MAVVAPAPMARTARRTILISDTQRKPPQRRERNITMDPRIVNLVTAGWLADQRRVAARQQRTGDARPARHPVHVQPEDVRWLRQLMLGTRPVAV
jgi:hypothetical protein